MSFRGNYSEAEQFSEVEKTKCVADPCHGGGAQYYVKKEEFEEVHEVSRTGGKHGGRGGRFEVHESKFEEDVVTATGKFSERKENIMVKAA